MKTLAPELRALIIIFGSAGPVISTRRSSRSAGAGATVQAECADLPRRDQEVGAGSGVQFGLAFVTPLEQVEPDRPEPALEVGHERERVLGQDAIVARDGAAAELDAGRQRTHVRPPRDVRSPR